LFLALFLTLWDGPRRPSCKGRRGRFWKFLDFFWNNLVFLANFDLFFFGFFGNFKLFGKFWIFKTKNEFFEKKLDFLKKIGFLVKVET
jgi:hypothetical protein